MTNSYSFKEIFDNTFLVEDEKIKLSKIVIPIIQRDYAQGRISKEVTRIRYRFLSSLYEALTQNNPIKLDFSE